MLNVLQQQITTKYMIPVDRESIVTQLLKATGDLPSRYKTLITGVLTLLFERSIAFMTVKIKTNDSKTRAGSQHVHLFLLSVAVS